MIEKLKEKTEEIYKAKNKVIAPKKNIIITIIISLCAAVILVGIYFFTGDIKYIVISVLAPVFLIIYAIYTYFKEKRHDKISEKDKQDFLSGNKYRKKEWKTSYYHYKENHSFETIHPKGMVYDLKKRYRKRNSSFMRIGILLIIGSLLILYLSVENKYNVIEAKDIVAAFFGIFIGAVIFSLGLHDYIGGPVQKFVKNHSDLSEIEKSYNKGKMLSFGNNGINLGSSYTVVYNQKWIYAFENDKIQDMTRKMVRVKQYEDNLYSGQEYRYYIRLIYKTYDGRTESADVRLDEFQCEMMIAEFNRKFYPQRSYDSTVSEKTDVSITV